MWCQNHGFQRRIIWRMLQMNPIQIGSSPAALSFDSMAHCAVQFEQLLACRGIGCLALRRMFGRKFGCPILLREPVCLGRTSGAEEHRARKSGESHGKTNCRSHGRGRLLANRLVGSNRRPEAYPCTATLSIDPLVVILRAQRVEGPVRRARNRALAFALVRLFLTECASLPWTHQCAGLSRRSPSCPSALDDVAPKRDYPSRRINVNLCWIHVRSTTSNARRQKILSKAYATSAIAIKAFLDVLTRGHFNEENGGKGGVLSSDFEVLGCDRQELLDLLVFIFHIPITGMYPVPIVRFSIFCCDASIRSIIS